MASALFEGVFRNGQIRLRDEIVLPESAQVYVVVPDVEAEPQAHVRNPRLARPEQAADFAKQIVAAPIDAEL